MEAMTGGTTLDLDRRYTISELDDLPEDGRRYELADGWLLVSPMARREYARLGIASYWLLDVDVPSLRVLELDGDDYVETAYGQGREAVAVERPFPVTLVPAALLAV
jgi:hypothetical protein